MPTGGPLATITLTPATASVAVGFTQQFTATGLDANGKNPYPAPTFTWTVSGGGAVGDSGLFVAGMTPGGPYTIKVSSGSISAIAQVTVTPKKLMTTQIGETNILDNDDSGNNDMVLAQDAILANAASIESLSLYVGNAAGNVRLGIYDDTGPNGGPGAKKAETNDVPATAGWMTVPVITPVVLPAGTYWLAYAVSDGGLSTKKAGDGTGNLATMQQPYGGPLPDPFSTTPNTDTDHWSLYATLTY